MLRRTIAFAYFVLIGLIAGAPAWAEETKDQSQIPSDSAPAAQQAPAPATAEPDVGAPAGQDEPQTEAPDVEDPDEIAPEELSLGEVPVIETVELTPDMAKHALDAFALVREKYREANLEDFESLQDFVDQAADGKAFEADIKGFSFADVTAWNTAITTVGFAYAAITDPKTIEDVKVQIEETGKDTLIAKDMKDRMIASLNAMIPSENNVKVIQALIGEPGYTDKLKLLAEEEE